MTSNGAPQQAAAAAFSAMLIVGAYVFTRAFESIGRR
jgi:hypothetical protein